MIERPSGEVALNDWKIKGGFIVKELPPIAMIL